jgi:tetratricopeptide (TPR) repeat protein
MGVFRRGYGDVNTAAVLTPGPTPIPSPETSEKTWDDYLSQGYTEENRDRQAAIADYTEAIRLKPDYAETYNRRGHVYAALKQYDNAITDYSEAIRHKPDNAVYYSSRGDSYYDSGQYGKAVSDYSEAIRIQPDAAFRYDNRATAYEALNNKSKAEQDHKKAKELRDKH